MLVGVRTVVIATIRKGNVFLPFCLLSHSGTVSSLAQTAKSLIEMSRLYAASLDMPNTLHIGSKLLRNKKMSESSNPFHIFFIQSY